jgi:hypothetical protein
MTTQHPITPPPELVEKWVAEIWHEGTPVQVSASDIHIAIQAARWAADQELLACCEWLRNDGLFETRIGHLRAARRPKAPSLKEQALEAMDRCDNEIWCEETERDLAIIRTALEQLND